MNTVNELHFITASMGSGKSLTLLSRAHSLKEKGFVVCLMKPSFDTRTVGTIKTRLGIEEPCMLIEQDSLPSDIVMSAKAQRPDFVFVDEAQFLNKDQVWDLADMVDNWGIGVVCYGLKLNHLGDFFEGTAELLKVADVINELPSLCAHNKGAKAHFHVKIAGDPEKGSEPGGDDMYVAASRKRWREVTGN